MIMITVGLNDQVSPSTCVGPQRADALSSPCCLPVKVFAISSEDRAVCFRQGVTSSELSGKTWKTICVPRDIDRSHSSASANSQHR